MSTELVEEDDTARELRLRIEALEAREGALEARMGRIERMLMSHEGEHQATTKLLTALNERVGQLVEAVNGLLRQPPPAPPALP